LTAQAHTPDAISHRLAKRAQANSSERIQVAEIFLRLALKAQSQCPATIEALGQLKNPAPVAFVTKANIAAQQQVNNGVPPQSASRAEVNCHFC